MFKRLSPRFAWPINPVFLPALRTRLQQSRYFYCFASLLFLAACGDAGGPLDTAQGSAAAEVQSSQAAALNISAGWLRMPVAGRDVSSGYFSIENNGTEMIELLSFRSPEVRAIELHEHLHNDGMMQMRRVAEKLLESGETLRMEPGGYHLMLFGVPDSLQAGSKITVEVVYASGESIAVGATTLAAREAG